MEKSGAMSSSRRSATSNLESQEAFMDTESLKSLHPGRTYHFCSTSCRDRFEKEPAKYAAAPARGEHQHGGHHHG